MPNMLFFLVGAVHDQVRLRARVGVKQNFLVRLEVLVERLRPGSLAEAPLAIEFTQGRNIAMCSEPHAAEQGVSHQHLKPTAIGHHGGSPRARRRGPSVLGRLARIRPLVDERAVDAAHHHAQPRDQIFQLLVALGLRHGAIERAERFGQVAQQNALVAHDAELLDIALEIGRAFDHIAQDRLRTQAIIARPRHFLAVALERVIQQIGQRFFVRHLGDALDALLVFDAVHLHLGHGRVARLAFLRAQNLPRIFKRGLYHGNYVVGIRGTFGVKQLQRRQQERRKRLVKREIERQIVRDEICILTVLVQFVNNHIGVDERLQHLGCTHMQRHLLLVGLQAVVNQLVHARSRIPALLNLGEHHRMRDAQTRRQLLRHAVNQGIERVLVPADEALGRALLLDLLQLLRVARGLDLGFMVLDVMLGRLGYHHALGVEAAASSATGNLMELAAFQAAHLAAVELGQLRQHHGVNGNVDANAQRIGAADDGQKPLLSKLFHQQAVTRQHARVMNAHAAAEQALQRLAEGGVELGALHSLLHGLALLLAGHAVAGQALRTGGGGVLPEMHDVQRALALAKRQLNGAFQGRERILVGKRHRARGVGDARNVARGLALKHAGDLRNVAERSAHQQKLRLRKREQRHLPGPTAVVVGEEMEFVAGHRMHQRVGPFAKRQVRQNLLRAADNGGRGVDMHVARDHAHVITAKQLH